MKRKILQNGDSVISSDSAMTLLLTDGDLPDHLKVELSRASKMFKQWYGRDIIANVDVEAPEAEIVGISDVAYEKLATALQKPRDEVDIDVHTDRINLELEWFERTGHLKFLCLMMDIVREFEEKNILWGIGRGSCVASYIMYVLKVHDVNPIEYDIDFSEFSKEERCDDEN